MTQDNNLFILGIFAFSLVFGAYGLQRFDKKQNKSKLENLADENKNGALDYYEKIKMYKMCGLKDTTEFLSALSLEKGIQNYKPKNFKTSLSNNSY